MKFLPAVLTRDHLQLREEVRSFLAEELPPGSYQPGLGMSGGHCPEFSRKLAARGWVGMEKGPWYGTVKMTPTQHDAVRCEQIEKVTGGVRVPVGDVVCPS